MQTSVDHIQEDALKTPVIHKGRLDAGKSSLPFCSEFALWFCLFVITSELER